MNNVTPIQPLSIDAMAEGSPDFDQAVAYMHGQMSKTLGLSPELLNTEAVASSSAYFGDLERRLLRQGQVVVPQGLRDYQIEAMKGILASLPLMKTLRKFKVVRTAKARDRKARRQALVKYSPAPFWQWGGTVTGRLNRTGPTPRWSIPKPRTGMTDLIKKMNEGSLDV